MNNQLAALARDCGRYREALLDISAHPGASPAAKRIACEALRLEAPDCEELVAPSDLLRAAERIRAAFRGYRHTPTGHINEFFEMQDAIGDLELIADRLLEGWHRVESDLAAEQPGMLHPAGEKEAS